MKRPSVKKKAKNDCTFCNGRGWFSVDMMGSGFYHCKHCNTYETVRGSNGTYAKEKTK